MENLAANWDEEKNKLTTQRDRNRALFSCVCRWMELYEDGADLFPYFVKHNYRKIAIYGAADIGRILLKELQREGNTEVSYFLDKTAESCKEKWGVPVYTPQELQNLPPVDIIVVTAFFAFDEIQQVLMQIRPEIAVISIDKIVGIMENEVWYAKR